MKLAKPAVVIETTVKLGYSESAILLFGIVLLDCTYLEAISRTSVFDAILLTGYLGGVVATPMRVGADLLSILFPAIFGGLLWLGLFLLGLVPQREIQPETTSAK